jgi:23S rRNA (guanosine2251-2'-O)-methyltransferase
MARKSWQPRDRFKAHPPRHRGTRPATRPRRDATGLAILYGWHTVKAALENPARRFRRLLATENALRRLTDDGVVLPLKPELVRPDFIDAQLGPDAVHQGLLAEAD